MTFSPVVLVVHASRFHETVGVASSRALYFSFRSRELRVVFVVTVVLMSSWHSGARGSIFIHACVPTTMTCSILIGFVATVLCVALPERKLENVFTHE